MNARQSSASSPFIWGQLVSIWCNCSGESIRCRTVRIFQYLKSPTSVRPRVVSGGEARGREEFTSDVLYACPLAGVE